MTTHRGERKPFQKGPGCEMEQDGPPWEEQAEQWKEKGKGGHKKMTEPEMQREEKWTCGRRHKDRTGKESEGESLGGQETNFT